MFAQYFQFIRHRMTPFRWDSGGVKFVNRFRKPACKRDAAGLQQHESRLRSGDLALKPHPEPGNDPDRFRHRNPVGTRSIKTGIPNRIQRAVTFVSESLRPHLADKPDLPTGTVGRLNPHVVFNHAPAPRLVTGDRDRFYPDYAVPAGQPRQAALEFRADLLGIER